MKVNHEIYRKATQKLMGRKELEDYIDVCLEAKMCPECGEDLITKGVGTSHPPVTLFDCSKCQFSWKEVRPAGRIKIKSATTVGGVGNTFSLPTELPVEKTKREKARGINK